MLHDHFTARLVFSAFKMKLKYVACGQTVKKWVVKTNSTPHRVTASWGLEEKNKGSEEGFIAIKKQDCCL